MKRYIGVFTALTLKNCSRINALIDDSAAPSVSFVAVDDSNGNEVDCAGNIGDIFLFVKNTSGANALIVTQVAYATIAGIVLPNEATSIPFGDEAYIGPINENNMLDSNIARFSFSGTTPSGKIMAMRVAPNNA